LQLFFIWAIELGAFWVLGENYTQFGLMAVSLSYYETLMSCSGSSTSSEMNEEEKELAEISPGLIGMSIGYIGTVYGILSELHI
jgi:methionine-gamma-lyase